LSAFAVAPTATEARKRSRVIPLSAAAAVAGAAVIAGMYFLRTPAPALTERDAILVADFVNTTGDPVFDGVLKQALAVQLEQSPYLNIVPDDRVRDTLRYMSRSPDERVTDSLAREICQRESIKAVLGGSIVMVGSHYVVALNATNCATGESIALSWELTLLAQWASCWSARSLRQCFAKPLFRSALSVPML